MEINEIASALLANVYGLACTFAVYPDGCVNWCFPNGHGNFSAVTLTQPASYDRANDLWMRLND